MAVYISSYAEGFQTGDNLLCVDTFEMIFVSSLILCQTVSRGRHVTIQQSSGDKMGLLELCDIRVYGKGECFYVTVI